MALRPLSCCEAHGMRDGCRQGRKCPHRVERDPREVLLDALAYATAYLHWLRHHGSHRNAKRFARSEQINARRARAERKGLRGISL